MDLAVLVLTADSQLGELVKAQVDNLGCRSSLVATYSEAAHALEWADGAVVDLVGEGLHDLQRLLGEAPELRVLGIAPDDDVAASARAAGAAEVLVEPFSITEIVEGVRALDSQSDVVIDLDAPGRPASADDKPWWATR